MRERRLTGKKRIRRRKRRPKYSEAVIGFARRIWERADYPCGVILKKVISLWLYPTRFSTSPYDRLVAEKGFTGAEFRRFLVLFQTIFDELFYCCSSYCWFAVIDSPFPRNLIAFTIFGYSIPGDLKSF
ncbi:MAG: hypothetical protein ACM3WV_05225 [Bacillota bacterium]